MKLDSLFDALANKYRRQIIYSVSLQPYSLTQLGEMYGLSLPALYKHIKILEKAKMIKINKIGRTKFITFKKDSLTKLQKWISQYQTYWGTNNSTLKNYHDFLRDKKKEGDNR